MAISGVVDGRARIDLPKTEHTKLSERRKQSGLMSLQLQDLPVYCLFEIAIKIVKVEDLFAFYCACRKFSSIKYLKNWENVRKRCDNVTIKEDDKYRICIDIWIKNVALRACCILVANGPKTECTYYRTITKTNVNKIIGKFNYASRKIEFSVIQYDPKTNLVDFRHNGDYALSGIFNENLTLIGANVWIKNNTFARTVRDEDIICAVAAFQDHYKKFIEGQLIESVIGPALKQVIDYLHKKVEPSPE